MHRYSVQIVVVKPLKPFKNSSRVSIMSGLTTTTYTKSNETMTTKYFTVGQWGRKRTEQKNNNNGKLLPRGYMGFWTGIEKPLMCKKRNVQNFTFFLKRPFIISLSLQWGQRGGKYRLLTFYINQNYIQLLLSVVFPWVGGKM